MQPAKPSPTGKAETDASVLARQSAGDFQRRLAIQMGRSEYAIACIAAPIRNKKGACAATISIVLADRQAEARSEELAAAVQNAAMRIELSIGFDGKS